LLGSALASAAAPSVTPLPEPTPGAFATSPEGWIDLLDKPDLRDWQREHYPAHRPMGETDPWKLDPASGILSCDATGIHEMLLHRTPRGDGIFRAEFRYVGTPAKRNSGLFVRTLPDASTWYQAQLAPTGLGMLFGQKPATGAKPARVSGGQRHPELLRPAGEWNEVEITCRGAALTLWINGHVAARIDGTLARGHVGLEAEFSPIEFRNLKFKPLP
jgi:hypothetical protein